MTTPEPWKPVRGTASKYPGPSEPEYSPASKRSSKTIQEGDLMPTKSSAPVRDPETGRMVRADSVKGQKLLKDLASKK